MGSPIGLIAGEGRFPLEVVRAAQVRGERVVAVALRDLADPALLQTIDSCVEIYLGQVEEILQILRDHGCKSVILAGKVPKAFLFQNLSALHPDARAVELWKGLVDRKDDSVLLAIAQLLEQEGFSLLEQHVFTPELLVEEGVLGEIELAPAYLDDIAFAWPIAKTLGDLDIGQTVVVKDGAVFSLEAIEGTDAAIRRGGGLSGPGACVVKVAKPRQDPRFDIPTVGLDTMRNLVDIQAKALAVEAYKTLLLEKQPFLEAANNHGIAVVGVTAESIEGTS